MSKYWQMVVPYHRSQHCGSDAQSVGWLENVKRTVTPAAAIGVVAAPEAGMLVAAAAGDDAVSGAAPLASLGALRAVAPVLLAAPIPVTGIAAVMSRL